MHQQPTPTSAADTDAARHILELVIADARQKFETTRTKAQQDQEYFAVQATCKPVENA